MGAVSQYQLTEKRIHKMEKKLPSTSYFACLSHQLGFSWACNYKAVEPLITPAYSRLTVAHKLMPVEDNLPLWALFTEA